MKPDAGNIILFRIVRQMTEYEKKRFYIQLITAESGYLVSLMGSRCLAYKENCKRIKISLAIEKDKPYN